MDCNQGRGARDAPNTAASRAPRRDTANRKGSIEVADFSPNQSISGIPSRIVVISVGAIGSILLHVALIEATVWGHRQHAPRNFKPPLMNLSPSQSEDITLQMVLIDGDAIADPGTAPPSIDTFAPKLSRIKKPDFPAVAVNLERDLPEPDATDAGAQQLKQYFGQILARIDRAWMRPSIPVGAKRFNCEARIEQDPAGNVVEVLLEQCNGTPEWQVSLVHAIQSASPLPAPPDPALFMRAIHMSFRAPDEEIAPDSLTPNPAQFAATRPEWRRHDRRPMY
jgi:CHASE2 domain-containing sensor protein